MNKSLFRAFARLFFVFLNGAAVANAVFDDKNNSVILDEVQEDVESLHLKINRLEQKINTAPLRPNLFNPGITAFGNFLTCFGQGGYSENAHGLCESPFVFREAELDIRAAVDPWADAVFILAFEPAHSHTHHEDGEHEHEDHEHHDHGHGVEASFQVEIEEAYITFKKLPILNTTPWGMQVKAGRFRVPFGRFNQIHLHDLPQSTPPPSLQAFLGPHGMIRNGLSVQIPIPTIGEDNSMNLTLQILNGGGLPFDSVEHTSWPAALGHLSWFWDFKQGHDLEVGLSAYVEKKPGNQKVPAQVYGVDANYKWRPFLFGDKHSFLFGTELYVAPKEAETRTLWGIGGFSFAQYQLNQWFYLGLRYDYRNLADNGHSVSLYATYYTTEFLRLRAGYEIIGESNFSNPRSNVLFEINFVFGSHPVEPYWVNR